MMVGETGSSVTVESGIVYQAVEVVVVVVGGVVVVVVGANHLRIHSYICYNCSVNKNF